MMPNLVTFEECAASLGVPPSQVRTAVSQLGVPVAETENGPAFDRNQMAAVSGQLRRAATAASFLASGPQSGALPPPFPSGLGGPPPAGTPEFSWGRPLPTDPGSTPVDGFNMPGRRNGAGSPPPPSSVVPPWLQTPTSKSASPLAGDTDINLGEGDTDFMADLDGPAVDPSLAFDDSPSSAGRSERSGSKTDVPNLANSGLPGGLGSAPGAYAPPFPGSGFPGGNSHTSPSPTPNYNQQNFGGAGYSQPSHAPPNFPGAGYAQPNPPSSAAPGSNWSAGPAAPPIPSRSTPAPSSGHRVGESTSELSAERFQQLEESNDNRAALDTINRTDDGTDSSSDISTRAIGIGTESGGKAGASASAGSTGPSSAVATSVASVAANVAAKVGLNTANPIGVEELVADPAMPAVLLVEPDEKLARNEQKLLTDRGLSAETVTGRAGMLLALRRRDFDLVLMAHVPGPDDGPRLLAELVRLRPNVRAAVLTPAAEYAIVEEAARRFGAFCLIKSDRFLSTFADQVEQMLRSSVPNNPSNPAVATPTRTATTATSGTPSAAAPASAPMSGSSGPKPAGAAASALPTPSASSAISAGSSARPIPNSSTSSAPVSPFANSSASTNVSASSGVSSSAGSLREELGDLGDRAPVGLFRLDARGVIQRANQRLAELLSFTTPTGLVGRTLADLCNEPDGLSGLLRDADGGPEAAESASRGRELSWVRADGRATRALVQLRRANRLSSPSPTYDGALLLATALPAAGVPEPVPLPAWNAALAALSDRLQALQSAVAETMTALRMLSREGPAALPKLTSFRAVGEAAAADVPLEESPSTDAEVAAYAEAAAPAGRSAEARFADAKTLDARQFGASQLAAGQLSAGQLSAGQLSAGQLSAGQLTVNHLTGMQAPPSLPLVELSAPSKIRDPESSMEVLLNPSDSAETLPANTVAKIPGLSSGGNTQPEMEATTVVAAVPLPQPTNAQPAKPSVAASVFAAAAAEGKPSSGAQPPMRTVSATLVSGESRSRPASRVAEPVRSPEQLPIFVVAEPPSRHRATPPPNPGSAQPLPPKPTTPAMPGNWGNPVMASIAADLASPNPNVQMTTSGPAVDPSSSIPIDMPSGFGGVQMSNSGFFDASHMASSSSDSRSGKTDSDNEVLDLNALTRQAVWFAEPKIKSNGRPIEIVQKLGNCSLVRGNRVRLREVIAKLLLNAADQMPGGGKIFLSSGTMAKGVFVAVRNTGAGISDYVRKHIFDDNFEPSEDWQRVLRDCLAVMLKHSGKIGLLSEPGKGSTVTIRLPPAVTSASEENTVLTRR